MHRTMHAVFRFDRKPGSNIRLQERPAAANSPVGEPVEPRTGVTIEAPPQPLRPKTGYYLPTKLRMIGRVFERRATSSKPAAR